MSKRTWWALSALLTLGCGRGLQDGASFSNEISIGPEGGRLEWKEGFLAIPQGALGAPVTVRVRPTAAPIGGARATYVLEPKDIVFAKKATVALVTAPGATRSGLAYHDGERWILIRGSHLLEGRVYGDVLHFSVFGDVDACQAGIECPAGSSCVAGVCQAADMDCHAEECNGADDDCNGLVDDGIMCGGGGGTCTPVAETCNGVDDDCNDVIDEGLSCPGTCGEGAECPPSFVCRAGACRLVCAMGEFMCPAGQRCVMQVCMPDPCAAVKCAAGTRCWEGECLAECGAAGTLCPANQRCQDGQCVSDCTPTMESCNGVDDDCNQIVDDGLVCGGACMSAADCPPNLLCVSGRCAGS